MGWGEIRKDLSSTLIWVHNCLLWPFQHAFPFCREGVESVLERSFYNYLCHLGAPIYAEENETVESFKSKAKFAIEGNGRKIFVRPLISGGGGKGATTKKTLFF